MSFLQNKLFKSRRFWTAVIGLAFMVATAFVPELEAEADLYTSAAVKIVGMLIGGFTVVDVVDRVTANPPE
jgi:hypothetical protein